MFEQDKGFTRGRSKSHNRGGDIRGKSKGREEGGSFPPMAMGFFRVLGEGETGERRERLTLSSSNFCLRDDTHLSIVHLLPFSFFILKKKRFIFFFTSNLRTFVPKNQSTWVYFSRKKHI